MIPFEKFTLENGLRVIVHRDTSTPIVAMNILYDVGARDEDPERTGFAHLFEHLMFGGSINIPKYDEPLEAVGGQNNAFTSNDVTNYYLTLPRQNLETAFWLESDRMFGLAFSEKSLEVQRNVVSEEFRQTHLNQPYGDVWLLLRPVAYQVHPYRWPTIGKEISHIAQAKMEDVRAFYDKFYNPDNAVMVVAGNVTTDELRQLSEKWFAPIANKGRYVRNLPQEPQQHEARRIEVERQVPADAIYKVWHMGSRLDPGFHTTDLISDVLSKGESSRFYQHLIKEKKLFSELDAFIMGSFDKGLFVVAGHPAKGVSLQTAEAAIDEQMHALVQQLPPAAELQKVKNKIEATLVFSRMNVLDKAMNLAFAELLGDANLINLETEKYQAVTPEMFRETASTIFRDTNSTTLFYKSIEPENNDTGI
ncbi:MAG: pitrilysin family protein [Bacteroidales bacterium]|nr:pitrilysin family protein [Bacteroidales bacterium]